MVGEKARALGGRLLRVPDVVDLSGGLHLREAVPPGRRDRHRRDGVHDAIEFERPERAWIHLVGQGEDVERVARIGGADVRRYGRGYVPRAAAAIAGRYRDVLLTVD